jgi:hypothetical protein
MSDWSDLGLPAPNVEGYGYSIDAGIMRTPFATAHPRQIRRHTRNQRTFSTSVMLTQAQLSVATEFLEADGFAGFTIGLICGRSQTVVTDLDVRVSDNYTVDAVGLNLYKLSMSLQDVPPRCTVVWVPEEYSWEPEPGRELQLTDDGWYYTGDYAGCDDCGSKLLVSESSGSTSPHVINFNITLYGQYFSLSPSIPFVAMFTSLETKYYYWDGTEFSTEYPAESHTLPAGVYSFAFPLSAGEIPVSIWVMLGRCETPHVDCPYSDRPWLLHDIVCV